MFLFHTFQFRVKYFLLIFYGRKMKLDNEIKGFIEKYKVNIWGTQDESLDMEDKELEDGMYCLGTSMGDDLVAHDEETIEVKDAWIMKNESLYQSLRFVIDKFFTTENIEDWMDTDDGDIIETLSFRGENIEGKLYIIFDFERVSISLIQTLNGIRCVDLHYLRFR